MERSLFLKFGNYLYQNHYEVYRPLYFTYKRILDAGHISLIRKVVNPGDSVLDIGANIGFYSTVLSDLVGESGRVYSFEPDEMNFERLSQQVTKRKNISIFKKAVANNSGPLMLYRAEDLNVDHQTYDSGDNRCCSEVEAVCLDEMFPNESFTLIKIDIQGFDFHALQGCKGLIERSKNITILGEFWPYGLVKSGIGDSWAYIEFLEALGFRVKVHGIESKSLRALEQEHDFYTNFIASKRDDNVVFG